MRAADFLARYDECAGAAGSADAASASAPPSAAAGSADAAAACAPPSAASDAAAASDCRRLEPALAAEGFQPYAPKGRVWAHQLTADEARRFFPAGAQTDAPCHPCGGYSRQPDAMPFMRLCFAVARRHAVYEAVTRGLQTGGRVPLAVVVGVRPVTSRDTPPSSLQAS